MGEESVPGGSMTMTGELFWRACSRRDMTMRSAFVRGRPRKRAKPRVTGMGGRMAKGLEVVMSLRIVAQR